MFQVSKPSRRWVRSFALSTAVAFAGLMIWALAMPINGSPDEADHMIKAYAEVHLVKGRYSPTTKANVFRIPAIYTTGAPCYAFDPNKPASCDKPGHGPPPFQNLPTTAEAYPPLFYLLVGWPTLFSSGLLSLYLMRVAGALVVAVLVALAVQNVRRVRLPGPLVLGMTAAITPAVFFFGGTVNPSGIITAAGLAVWLGGLVLVRGEHVHHMTLAVSRVGAPLCLLLLVRRDSVYWAAMIILSLVLLTPRERWRGLIRCRAAWAWATAAVICIALQLLLWGGQYGYEFVSSNGQSHGGNFWGAVGSAENIARAIMGGTLGWLDVDLPFPVLYIFVVSTGFLVVWALGFALKQVALTLGAMTAMAIAAPLVVGSFRYPYFQGRYMLPLTVGFPVVAAIGITEVLEPRFWRQRFLLILFPLLWLAQVFSLAQTLRRFTAGAQRNWWFFAKPQWEPPMASPTVLLVLFVLAVTALYVRLYSLSLQTPGQVVSVAPSGPKPRRQLTVPVAEPAAVGLASVAAGTHPDVEVFDQELFEPAPANGADHVGLETVIGADLDVKLFDQELFEPPPLNGADRDTSAEQQRGMA